MKLVVGLYEWWKPAIYASYQVILSGCHTSSMIVSQLSEIITPKAQRSSLAFEKDQIFQTIQKREKNQKKLKDFRKKAKRLLLVMKLLPKFENNNENNRSKYVHRHIIFKLENRYWKHKNLKTWDRKKNLRSSEILARITLDHQWTITFMLGGNWLLIEYYLDRR